MLKLTVLLIACITVYHVQAQYYYKDIVANTETNQLNQLLKKSKATAVRVTSIDFDDSPIDNFLCEQTINNNAKHIITITGSPYVGENHLHAWYNNASQITRSVDSNPSIIIQNNYEYTQNMLSKITITSYEQGSKDKVIEQHHWLLDSSNRYTIMYRIKQGTDTTVVRIIRDTATQLPIEEIVLFKGKEKEHFYYYYDATNLLTDVVKYHTYKQKLLPEVIQEYGINNQLTKKTMYTSGTKEYEIWMYKYNELGLKTEEQCYLRGNMFRGKLVYNYNFEK